MNYSIVFMTLAILILVRIELHCPLLTDMPYQALNLQVGFIAAEPKGLSYFSHFRIGLGIGRLRHADSPRRIPQSGHVGKIHHVPSCPHHPPSTAL